MANTGIGVYKYIFIWRAKFVSDVGLPNSMVLPMKLGCVFNKVFLVNHWFDILNCNRKWLCFSNL